jgi:hypothetical protein
MADEVATLKQLQAGLNAAFESVFTTIENDPKNVKAIAASKEQLVGLSHATIGTALGPAFSLISLSATVCYFPMHCRFLNSLPKEKQPSLKSHSTSISMAIKSLKFKKNYF